MTVVKCDWFRNIVTCKGRIQFRNSVDIGGDIFNKQIRDNEGLWLPLVQQSYVTYRETKNRTMALQHPHPLGVAAVKTIWPSPESLYILISSKDKNFHQAPMDEGGEAGTKTLLFCASQRQHWAVRPLLPHRQCSLVEPCSSRVQDRHGLAHVFAQPSSSILHKNFG